MGADSTVVLALGHGGDAAVVELGGGSGSGGMGKLAWQLGRLWRRRTGLWRAGGTGAEGHAGELNGVSWGCGGESSGYGVGTTKSAWWDAS